MLRVKPGTALQTSFACPSQWQARGIDGCSVHVRYRYGALTVSVDGRTIFIKTCGEPLDGVMSYSDMIEQTKDFIEWPDA